MRASKIPKGVPSFSLEPAKFITHLSFQDDLTEDEKRRIMERYDAHRAATSKERRQRAQLRNAWAVLIGPLSYEANNVMSAIRYFELSAWRKPEDPALPVLREYHAILEQLLTLFKQARSNLKTVAQYRSEFEDALPAGITLPNDGEHWTDWIAPKTKRRIEAAFAGIPHKAKAKRRIPFRRDVERPKERKSIPRPTPKTKEPEATSVTPQDVAHAVVQAVMDAPDDVDFKAGKDSSPTSPDHVLRDGRIEPRDEAFRRNTLAYIGTDDEHEAFATYAHSLGFRVLSRGVSGAYIVPAVQALYLRWKKAKENHE